MPGGLPKAIELFVTEDVADLSIYGIGSANNGGGSDGEEFTLSGSATAGDHIYIASETDGFTDYFGFAPDFTAGAANINGDDAIELFENGTVIDLFGDIDTDGTGQPWEHLDGWAYRVSGSEASPVFDISEWTFSGPNALDGETSNETAISSFPIRNFTTGAAQGTASDLLISEIVEGSSFNKAIEIFNGTGADVDLSAYSVAIYFNGNTAASTTVVLSGTLAAGAVHVIADDGASAAILAEADVTPGGNFFNGDDAIVLFKGEEVVDSFGQVGTDPGSQWPGGGQNDTLVRKASVFEGDTDIGDAFDAALEWEVLPQDDVSNLGTHTFDGGGETDPALSLTLGADTMPEDGGSVTATLTRTGDISAELTVTLGSSDTSEATVPATVTFAAGSATATFTVTAIDDAEADADQPVTITAAAPGFDDATAEIVVENDEVVITRIHEIQGANGTEAGAVVGVDDVSVLAGETVTIEAVVTADFQSGGFGVGGDMGGFYVQEEITDYDFSDLTSEGIFIFEGYAPEQDVQVGDKVRVTGVVDEYSGQTQIENVVIEILSSGNALPTAVEVEFPVASVQVDGGSYVANLEAYEGMLVNLPNDFVVTEMFNLDRFEEYRLGLERYEQFTQSNDPDAGAYDAFLREMAQGSIVMDDGSSLQNDYPLEIVDGNDGVLTAADDFRMGDQIGNVSGVLGYGFSEFRIQNGTGDYTKLNDRPETPEEVDGNFRVASMNVLNLFSTLDTNPGSNNGPDVIGPDGDTEPRGANSEAEFQRQLDKIVNAIVAMDANIFGLVEIENDFLGAGGVSPEEGATSLGDPTIQVLVDAVNAALGDEVFGWVDPGQEFVGGDAISNALIYRTDRVALVGEMAILEEFEGRSFYDPLGAGRPLNRPAIAQTFEDLNSGETLTVSVNHLKSKGSLSGLEADDAQGDGQGNNNATREAAAEMLSDWLATDPTGQGAENVLILGDLNSYAREDPIKALQADGYVDLGHAANPDAYSYVFDGQVGTLDYALANGALFEDFAGATEWNINSDEADALDYNLDFGKDPSLYTGDTATRYSDHDPVIVGFDFYNLIAGSNKADKLDGGALNDKIVGGGGNDKINGLAGSDLLMDGAGNDKIDAGVGADTFVWQGGRRDNFTGGEGADTIVVDASVVAGNRRDTLSVDDYEVGVDIVDLNGLAIADSRSFTGFTEVTLEGGRDKLYFWGVDDLSHITFAGDVLLA
ncbi:extracellular nuclease [Pseudooceanicola batsensis HTCC2597]|uniref:Extracellular nuclease n=1 Tax=Pseudooceanicola batsensis (strain ATCC BAA-863 / DSM 15984 / KCTC 12145 / HTCC2597) TaxID=252305 RepID=A3TTF6_PSEBH|nr:extracellular nuclease [Pseudooceanicola batsensis HTCC2597]